ncbi:ABC transporter ATP-binding protein [Curvibacter sp. APW13]|uniref:ABC transporter ATP-binding protein n=1 Tax=Curvibacter sp. APW13 TaxID=3077236 RepID=UPI0028DEC4ED|nr:ABC transporter ATP-binding protein [Curvibacter sp. APW13]MDT8992073.1 ABC transporter ATP-binding protein [Curvibacter sp. APW13]
MLELESVCKTWRSPAGEVRPLLQGVSLSVAQGETVALLGASGSGKSTLLRIVAGIEPLESGVVRIDGQSMQDVAPERRGVGLIFQDFALFPHLDVWDNVAFGLVEQGTPKAAARAQAQAMLQSFGLQVPRGHRVWQLSGGEQQRVALARALVVQPRVLLLDEPLSALDADLRHQLRADFLQRIARHGTAALWVTHDEDEARAVGQRGYRLVEGVLQPLW